MAIYTLKDYKQLEAAGLKPATKKDEKIISDAITKEKDLGYDEEALLVYDMGVFVIAELKRL